MSSFLRFLAIFFAGILFLLMGGGLVWYLAYGIKTDPPREVSLTALNAPAQVHWLEDDIVAIEASDQRDAAVALGYVHGRTRAWSIILARQAALGELTQWFGFEALEVDRLVGHLELADRARRAYETLERADRDYLDAYAAGLRQGLQEQKEHQPELLLLSLNPEPWQPWHTLALERLYAWLAILPPAEQDIARIGSAGTAFFAADRSLRQWLQLHGFENSVAWALRGKKGTHFFQRHVYGATALPFFQEVTLSLRDGFEMQGNSLPGTPFFPAGKTRQQAWSLQLTSPFTLQETPWDSTQTRRVYQRMADPEETEKLMSYWNHPDHLILDTLEQAAAQDTIWTAAWSGLAPTTDVSAWRSLLSGTPVPFHLLHGNGLLVRNDGSWEVMGQPLVATVLTQGIFVGNTSWAAYPAEMLELQEANGDVAIKTWIDDTFSPWAAMTAPPLIDGLSALAPASDTTLHEALTYLINWDYSYDRAGIAASIFDTWLRHHREVTGSFPIADSASLPTALHTLQTTVDLLTQRYGEDMELWRWERIQPHERHFPLWSIAGLQGILPDEGLRDRFASVTLPGQGHPTALAWGASPLQGTLAAPASWEAWFDTSSWDLFTIRRYALHPYTPFGRYLASDRLPEPLVVSATLGRSSVTFLTP